MARDIWATSDTHFQHGNILNFTLPNGNFVRPEFSCVEEMDETIIQNWNSVVKKGDLVYHLGDVFMGDKETFCKLWPRLNGKKRLVIGNHDDVIYMSRGGFFSKITESRIFKEFGIVFTHRPMHVRGLLTLYDKRGTYPDDAEYMTNVHGHIHAHNSPEGPYRNICVEKTNYTPVNIEDLRTR